MNNRIDLGQFMIRLPDGDDKSFMIYHDLASLMGLTKQGLAVKKIRKQLKERNILPVPNIYFENSTGIRTSKPNVIFEVVKIIDDLSLIEFKLNLSQDSWEDLKEKLVGWKPPKKQKWRIGDIFSIKLRDDSFAFGQVLSTTPTIALIDLKRRDENIVAKELKGKRILSIFHTTSGELNNHSWKIIANTELLAKDDSGPDGHYSLRIGLVSYSPNVLYTVCDYYWFGINKWVNEEDLKKMIIGI